MASITGTVSPASITTARTSMQEKILDVKVAQPKPRETQNKPRVAQDKPLSHPGKFVQAGLHKVAAGNATQAKQLHQIAEGVRTGKLSSKEAETLLKGQQDLFTASSRAMADGKMTAKESIELAARRLNTQKTIDAALKGGERSLGAALGLDKNAKTQAAQLEKLATGIGNGTITRAETGHLLGQQVSIADARGDADTTAERTDLSNQLARAGKELERHSKAGTQLDKVVKTDRVHVAVARPIKG